MITKESGEGAAREDAGPESLDSRQTANEEPFLEVNGWASRSELDAQHSGWMVEIPEAAVPEWLRARAAEYAEEAAQIWGLPPVILRWYRATRNRAVAEAQWRRTQRAFERAGIAREPRLHPESTDLSGFADGSVSEEMIAEYPGQVIVEDMRKLEPIVPDGIPEVVLSDGNKDNQGEPIIYLSGDPHSFEPPTPLNALIAHETLHLVQYRAEYPLRVHERMAYWVGQHWTELRTGFRRMTEEQQTEVHQLLRTGNPNTAAEALCLLTRAAIGNRCTKAQRYQPGKSNKSCNALKGGLPRQLRKR